MKDGTACREKDGRFFVLLPTGEPGVEYKLPPDPLEVLPEVPLDNLALVHLV